jgi:hypothetical protein
MYLKVRTPNELYGRFSTGLKYSKKLGINITEISTANERRPQRMSTKEM